MRRLDVICSKVKTGLVPIERLFTKRQECLPLCHRESGESWREGKRQMRKKKEQELFLSLVIWCACFPGSPKEPNRFLLRPGRIDCSLHYRIAFPTREIGFPERLRLFPTGLNPRRNVSLVQVRYRIVCLSLRQRRSFLYKIDTGSCLRCLNKFRKNYCVCIFLKIAVRLIVISFQ
jgi:hypothetical protein